MKTTLFSFPTDFAGESVATVLERVRDVAKVGGVTVAANYHAARDVFPHNPRYKVHVSYGGSLYFDAQSTSRTSIGATCPVDPLAGGPFSFPSLVVQARSAGLSANGWINYCHLDNFAAPPSALSRNAFGDYDPSTICPSSPETIEFAVALTADVAAAQPDGLVAESIHFNPVVHGFHHERWFIEIGELARYLLGLCFCENCRAGIASRGGDPDRLMSAVRATVDAELAVTPSDNGPSGGLTAQKVVEVLGDEVLTLWAHRDNVVTVLADAISAAARETGTAVQFVDPSGATKGYSSGRPSGLPGPLPAWVLGADPVATALRGGSVGVLAYVQDAGRLRLELDAYAEIIGDANRIAVTLRPAPPDCRSPEDLLTKVAACRQVGLEQLSFYHYALFRLEALDWIRQALAA